MPISDILSCPEDQLEDVLFQENPYEHGQRFLAKNIGMIELCQLGALLELGSYDDLKTGFHLVGEPLPDGPWPQTIPSHLVAALASISDEQIDAVCPQWAASEEFRGSAPAESLAEYLKDLREFLNANSGPFFLVNAL